MTSVKGSQTEKNLLISFSGEGQARNRYTYWASVAKKEGYEQIAFIFDLTANQEKEHAKRFFKFLEGGNLTVCGEYPAGIIGSTLENLQEAAKGEHHEAFELYPSFAKTALEEGFKEISNVFNAISEAEKNHQIRYEELAHNIEKKEVFKRLFPIKWQCRNCGYSITSKEAPLLCPSCAHKQSHFELFMHNW